MIKKYSSGAIYMYPNLPAVATVDTDASARKVLEAHHHKARHGTNHYWF